MQVEKIGAQAIAALAVGAAAAIIVPVIVAIIWKIKKKEPVTTILIGAATFFLFVVILEKPIQNVLAFPTAMGLPDHAVSRFLSAKPVLLALVTALFPGVFEETGRLVAFKTVLKKRRNRETSISHGIGHGGFEAMYLIGSGYITYIAYAVMLNTGLFSTIADQVKAAAPAQLDTLYETMNQIAALSFADVGLALAERVFAVLFHIGASILVFYACRDRKKFMLYPAAIVLHTVMDFIATLSMFNVIKLSPWALEGIVAVFGILVFALAYFLLYRRDKGEAQTYRGGEEFMAANTEKLLYQGHASVRIITAGGKVIYIDPYAGEGYGPAADLILITHAHSDHTNVNLIKSRNPGCRVITWKEALEGGEHRSFAFDFVTVEAVEAGYNRNHDVSGCVGYILTFPDGISVYFSGDTSKTRQMPLLVQRNLDYAFFCCDGIYNMDLDEAAHCAALTGAKHNIPYHMAPGKLFDMTRAGAFAAPDRLIITPGSEIQLYK